MGDKCSAGHLQTLVRILCIASRRRLPANAPRSGFNQSVDQCRGDDAERHDARLAELGS